MKQPKRTISLTWDDPWKKYEDKMDEKSDLMVPV